MPRAKYTAAKSTLSVILVLMTTVSVSTDVEISNQFLGWLCGFGKRAGIETPDIAAAYTAFLDKLREMY